MFPLVQKPLRLGFFSSVKQRRVIRVIFGDSLFIAAFDKLYWESSCMSHLAHSCLLPKSRAWVLPIYSNRVGIWCFFLLLGWIWVAPFRWGTGILEVCCIWPTDCVLVTETVICPQDPQESSSPLSHTHTHVLPFKWEPLSGVLVWTQHRPERKCSCEVAQRHIYFMGFTA